MEFPLNEATVALITGVLTLLTTKAVDFFKVKHTAKLEEKKYGSAEEKFEVKQALGMYRDIIVSLREDMKKMMDYFNKLREDHLNCREENAALRAEVKSLTERIRSLEEELRKERNK